MKKYCVKCGKQFESVGREVICPACKQAAAEESKKAAVLKAKRASWAGESVPVRISGRASAVIRRYGAANNLPFAAALDNLLKSSDYFKGIGVKWESVEPYKSHRRDKSKATSTTETAQEAQDAPQKVKQAQEVKQAAGKPQKAPQEVKQAAQAAKVANKNTTSTAAKKAASTSKAAAGKKETK